MSDDSKLRAAFEAAVRDHGAMVARIASSYEARPALQQELAQEAFAALWRAMPSFRGEASLKTFAARIAHNVCVSHVRREARASATGLDDQLADDALRPDEAAALAIDRERLLDAVRRLPLALRQVATLHLEGFSDQEAADALGLERNAAAVRLTRARAKLRALMGVEA